MTAHDPLIDALDAPSAPSVWSKDDPAKPGDTVVLGPITHVSERETEYGTYLVLTGEVEAYYRTNPKGQQQLMPLSGVHAVHCAGSILDQKVREENPRPGGRIAIRFDGERATKDGKRTYKAWSVKGQAPKPGADLVQKFESDEEPF